MVQTPEKLLSLEEFLALPETEPASEYIDGRIIQKPMPQGKHSIIQRELSFALTLAFRPASIAQAFPELRCTFGDRSVVPDVAVFRSEHIPRDLDGQVSNSFNLPPDWTIEILSPRQSQTRVTRNVIHCLDHGCEMGWIIDPAESLVFTYGSGKSVSVFEDLTASLPTPEFAAAVNLTPGEVFGWLQV
ncbi:Uma2 family endonuclease [cf. Phormidesmis sp. LEGE 11477]|uniref:Uma2 family endonuclease n=1 Tax=cf. Phormidesmis sp. LEGE 11477 TaxID=1828680 RepID=UPI00187F68B9|nr:Uma2 family endonuclease [cf. Phormidesmis sp. LEGE 11477]MBE9062982.1 Uma2 family endonuclease [cf. Phormidesmis sp. LEGE 11477]